MSDLVDRLRDEACRQDDWANDGESTVVGSGPELLMQAADRIEELEAALAICSSSHESCMAEVERLDIALAKLRKVVEELANWDVLDDTYSGSDAFIMKSALMDAIAAVQEKGDE